MLRLGVSSVWTNIQSYQLLRGGSHPCSQEGVSGRGDHLGTRGWLGASRNCIPENRLVSELVTSSGERCICRMTFRITCLGNQARQILFPRGLFAQRHKTV